MSPHGALSRKAPVAVNISMATGWLMPGLVRVPTRKSPDKTLVVPLVGVTAHSKSRRITASAWSTGVAPSTAACVSSRRCKAAKKTPPTTASTSAATPTARIISISVNARKKSRGSSDEGREQKTTRASRVGPRLSTLDSRPDWQLSFIGSNRLCLAPAHLPVCSSRLNSHGPAPKRSLRRSANASPPLYPRASSGCSASNGIPQPLQ